MPPIETIFTAVDRVAMNGDDEIPLVDGLSLIKPNAELTSGSWSNSVTGMDELEIKQASCQGRSKSGPVWRSTREPLWV
jgi:hypothetical protein